MTSRHVPYASVIQFGAGQQLHTSADDGRPTSGGLLFYFRFYLKPLPLIGPDTC